jgi:hypothetical protein
MLTLALLLLTQTPPSCDPGQVARTTACIPVHAATDAELRAHLVRESIRGYSGACACPESVTAAGRRCGGNSAYSRRGGARPLCYPTDVTNELVTALRERWPG